MPIKMAIIKKKKKSVGEEVEKLESSCIAVGKCKWNACEKTVW